MQKILHYNEAYRIDEIVDWLESLTKDKTNHILYFQIIESGTYYDDDYRCDKPTFDCVVLTETTDLRFSWDTTKEDMLYGKVIKEGI